MAKHDDPAAPPATPGNPLGGDLFGGMLEIQGEMTRSVLSAFGNLAVPDWGSSPQAALAKPWETFAGSLRDLWSAPGAAAAPASAGIAQWLEQPEQWRAVVEGWYRALPLADGQTREQMLADGLALWENLLSQFAAGDAKGAGASLPRKDRRFADPRWREQPVFALIHQCYLLLSEQLLSLADKVEGLDPAEHDQLVFATRTLVEALSPANFPLTNPVVLDKIIETRGENLVKGMDHLLADLGKGRLTHADESAFELGRNLAATPGKVVHETPLYQLIQYSPTTETVAETPLVIFPPWINRFYILDLTPQKSFVRWAVDQGISVFMVSWKSADASMADLMWDDYIRAQIDAIDVVRARLKVPAVDAIGYCVAGTTLAATLAILARRGEGGKVRSATFFTAQVDFEQAGDLKAFIDDRQLAVINSLATDGYLDGRYLAATFNLLRSSDLIWNTVIRNYLLGEEYPAFDLLYWNGDTTNLPARWHQSYLKDLYRDNLLVQPDRLEADGTPIDLSRIAVPCFIQAGVEDHIAPPQSVWRMTRHLKGPWTFLLAGSGHIAGVVNPPAANKYQYWTNPAERADYDSFRKGAEEHPGSWWPIWRAWLADLGERQVAAKGKRAPGGRGDKVIEDAPGRYVKTP
ncbi:PHA/PHB synthase family protein [Novosphingobium bradum]|uniref:PHA/PHB synthase family protein n=1 Tax=Novosphingobium bradum TaxID=1737444 RepID=A0ABV7IQ74_9SPHN